MSYSPETSPRDNYDSIEYSFKVILVGNSGVGKTNILSRYLKRGFTDTFRSTIGVEFGAITRQRFDKIIKIQFWDTTGQERYKSISRAYYRKCDMAILVYDITNYASWVDLKTKWLYDVKGLSECEMPIVVIGNKSDLNGERNVPMKEVAKHCVDNNFYFMEISAKDTTNVMDSLEMIIETLYNNIESKLQEKEPDVIRIDHGTIKKVEIDDKDKKCDCL